MLVSELPHLSSVKSLVFFKISHCPIIPFGSHPHRIRQPTILSYKLPNLDFETSNVGFEILNFVQQSIFFFISLFLFEVSDEESEEVYITFNFGAVHINIVNKLLAMFLFYRR